MIRQETLNNAVWHLNNHLGYRRTYDTCRHWTIRHIIDSTADICSIDADEREAVRLKLYSYYGIAD